MGVKKIEGKELTEEDIERKLAEFSKHNIAYVDPMKMAAWTLERACAMVDNAVSPKTIERAIADGSLSGFKAGAKVAVIPTDFLTWFKRFKKQ